MPHFDNAPEEMNALMERVWKECKDKGDSDEEAAKKAIAAAKEAGYEEKDGKWSKAKMSADPNIGIFSTEAKFGKDEQGEFVQGVLMEPGTFSTSRGKRIITPAFVKLAMAKFASARLCVVDATHPDKPPVTVDVGRVTKTGVNAQGQGVFRAKPFNTTLARDTWELAKEYGRLGVSMDGPCDLASDRATMTDIDPRYIAVLPMGDQAIPNSYVEVAKFSAAAGAFDSFNPKVEVKDGNPMDEKEIQALKERAEKAEGQVAKFSQELAAAKAQLDAVQAAKDEAERVKLLDETAKFAKKFGDKEPAATATLPELRALRAGFAEKALAKFGAEAPKGGAELQQTAPPAAGNEEKPKRQILIVD